MNKKQEYCPTQKGNTIAWRPQYKDGDGEWRDVATKLDKNGMPPEKYRIHAIEDLGLHTYAQAMALAWSYAAFVAAEVGKDVEVRAQEYEVVYDIKARIINEA